LSFCPHFPRIYSYICRIWCKKSAYNGAVHLWVSWKLTQGRPYILRAEVHFIWPCTVKALGVLKVKNALVSCACHAKENTVCSRIVYGHLLSFTVTARSS